MSGADSISLQDPLAKERILVHVHLYYHEMWGQLRSCLENLEGESWDLCVTLVEYDGLLEDEIKTFKADALVLTVANRGFDIGPFFEALRHYELSNYAYVIKLHSKRNMMPCASLSSIVDVGGPKWRELLLSFIGSKDNFKKCLKAFRVDPTLGMIGHYSLIQEVVKRGNFNKFVLKQAKDLLKALKLTPYPAERFVFVAGTMFMVRAQIVEKLKILNLGCEDFEVPDRQKRDFDFAHVCEYLFGWMVSSMQNAQGEHYCIADPYTSLLQQKSDFRYLLSRHLYLKKFYRFVWRRTYNQQSKSIELRIFKLKIPRWFNFFK